MTLTAKFLAQRIAFEQAYEDGRWERLKPYFTDDMTYEVMNVPFHCVIEGVDAFAAGLKWSTDRFDKLCVREVGFDRRLAEEGNNVVSHSGIRFTYNGSPPIATRLWEIATFRDGLIDRIIDIYDPGDAERFNDWMAQWGEGLDPRYQ
tara:strand:- start:1623 stop:2066 length:444 start_codon:yes stop_codon:yes gene_type:complete